MSLPFFKDFMLQLAIITTLIFTYQIFFAERSGYKSEKVVLAVLFGLSILLCMTFPAPITPDYRIDIRIIPLLMGTLYGGWSTGLILTAIILLYRFYIGIDMGLYTTTITLLISMPVILFFQRYFLRTKKKNKRMQLALLLLVWYSFVGILSVTWVRGIAFLDVVKIHNIHIVVNVAALLFFITLNETIREMIRKTQDAEIAFLRSQIKPHFLHNALNSIAALCIDEPKKAQDLTLSLSQYLRGSFHFKKLDSLTTIGNELELVKAYLHIEKTRFGDRLNVEFKVDADPDVLLPPLMVQPLVENAIRHGLMSNASGGTVKVSIQQEADGIVRFTVEDNGCGMSPEKQNEVLGSDGKEEGIGLWNIRKRYQLLYGKSIRVESAEGAGTKISFDIPARPSKQTGG
ncbi:sensor histidine kinase [Paenibacillus koleovorans]|uniref:sensor histidine kinase n=1 Tax=Paenibacillus koleovorans TaxID=121608 RepID=UPI000FD9A412|nr:histidine kinase [Paenibacillus koleovorans]